MKVPRTFKTSLPLDGQLVRCQIRRMSQGEAAAFNRDYERHTGPSRLDRRLRVRKPGEEMATRPIARPLTVEEELGAQALAQIAADQVETFPDAVHNIIAALRALVPTQPEGETFVVSDEDIALRRLDELSPDEYARLTALQAEHDAARVEFYADAITRFVTSIDPGDITEELEDGTDRPVTTGAAFVEVFSSREDVLRLMVDVIRVENSLSEARKKVLRSRFGFDAFSPAPATAATGSAPEPTAGSASAPASATSEAATASSASA